MICRFIKSKLPRQFQGNAILPVTPIGDLRILQAQSVAQGKRPTPRDLGTGSNVKKVTVGILSRGARRFQVLVRKRRIEEKVGSQSGIQAVLDRKKVSEIALESQSGG